MPSSFANAAFASYVFEEIKRSRRASYRWVVQLRLGRLEEFAAIEDALLRTFGGDCKTLKKPTLLVAHLAPIQDASIRELMDLLEVDGSLVLFGTMTDLVGSAEERSSGWRSRWPLQQLFFCDLNVCAAVVVKGWRQKPILPVKFY